jgi:hypothetical protein
MNRHLSHDELLSRIYGLEPDHSPEEATLHLRECAECAARLQEFEQRRADSAAAQEIPTGLLASQRREIYAKLEDRPAGYLALTPALAAVFLLAVGVLLYQPSRPAAPETPLPAVRVEQTDDQFFADLYSLEQTLEPQAAAPIHALFEPGEEVQ